MLALALALLPARLPAREQTIYYYVTYANSWDSFAAHVAKIGTVAPQAYTFDADGEVAGSVEPRVCELAAQRGVRVLPVLTNKGFSGDAVHAVVNDPRLSRAVAAKVIEQCRADGCWGLQLDIENIAPADGPAYARFVQQAAKRAHDNRLQLGVVVPSPLFPGNMPLKEYRVRFGNFPVTPLPFDFAALGKAADFVTVMTYDQYSERSAPGPMAGYAWTEDTIRDLLQYIPRDRLSLGIGFYARRWCNQKTEEMTFSDVQALLARTKAAVEWHPWQRAPWFEYPGDGCKNVVWFENRKSLKEKLDLARKYRLHGFSAWRLGQEDPEFWKDAPRP